MESMNYETQFIEFQNELKSFIYRLVANQQDMEDIVQDAYIKATANIASFKGDSSYKTWVFTIATNIAKDLLKKQSRWGVDYQDTCRTATYASKEIQGAMFNISQNSPQGKYVLKEHIDYCFTCMSKTLLVEEQICVTLKEVYHFKVHDIMQITGLTEGKVKHAIANSRKRLQDIFDNRCTLINKTGACHQCTELNGMFNPKQNAVEETMKLKMVKEKDNQNYESLFELRLQLVKGIDLLNSEGFDFHNYMLENLPSHSN
jgi:RNA polymerase sigma-70 factor (ECF subfamily)